jgi:hypothetical protein
VEKRAVEKLAVEKLLRKLIRKPSRTPRVMVTNKLGAYGAARTGMDLNVEHRRHKGLNHMGLNNRAENAHLPTLRRKRIMKRIMKRIIKRSTSARHLKRLVFFHDPVANLHFSPPRHIVIRRSDASFRGDHRLARDRRTGYRRAVTGGQRQGKAPGESARESSPSSHGRRSAS